eukprot:m.41062 g.41062  ORF g.41062 m.41062 type:complete len:105 (-) comp14187_c0_seq1:212-526(-)
MEPPALSYARWVNRVDRVTYAKRRPEDVRADERARARQSEGLQATAVFEVDDFVIVHWKDSAKYARNQYDVARVTEVVGENGTPACRYRVQWYAPREERGFIQF